MGVLPVNSDGELDLSKFDMFEFFNGVLKNGAINESIFETLLGPQRIRILKHK